MNSITTVQGSDTTKAILKNKCRLPKKIHYVIIFAAFFLLGNFAAAQKTNAQRWADSVFKTLSLDEQIAQLMVVRLSTIDPKTKQMTFFDSLVSTLVKQYNIGGVCLFQGSPVKQAIILNNHQCL